MVMVTRGPIHIIAEIEEIRGVSTSKGTVDVLLETGWIKLRGRRRAPGRPITYGTTEQFLAHFGFDSIQDLPGSQIALRRNARSERKLSRGKAGKEACREDVADRRCIRHAARFDHEHVARPFA